MSTVKFTKEQQQVIRCIKDWFEADDPDIRVGGLAGTGKTTIAGEIPRVLGLSAQQVAYCAFTGKAADVLSRRLPTGTEATTIHRLIYKPQEWHCRDCPASKADERCHGPGCPRCYVSFSKVPELEDHVRLVVCDEASMVNEEIYDDLIAYGVPVVWIGDHGQLPPVKGDFNLMDDPDVRLETIHRQAAGSPILKLAMKARDGERIPAREYAPGVSKRTENGYLDWEEDRPQDQAILCGYNRTRVAINKVVRSHLDFPDDRPVVGDRVICLRNNANAGVFNGNTGTITDIRVYRREKYRARIQLDGGGEYMGVISAEQFNHEKTIMEISRNTDLWDYGYCLTVHKAQGSEFKKVILIEQQLGPPSQHRRWLYTAITRAVESLEIIAS
jgi:exodeoxyribonuclease-5